MPEVIVYTKLNCLSSEKTKQILQSNKIKFIEKDISFDVLTKREMIERTGGRANTPQIFIQGKHIGSFSELADLEKLDKFG